MGLDDRPQRTAAAAAVTAGAAGFGDVLGGACAVGYHFTPHVTRGSGAQADEHGYSCAPTLIRWANRPTNRVG